MENNTMKVMKVSYRKLGSGWIEMEYLDTERLDEFIIENKVREYIIYQISIVNLELEEIEVLFKGVKYVPVAEGRLMGSSKYDRDDTPVKETNVEQSTVNNPVIKPESKKTVDQSVKLNKTNFMILKANGEKEYLTNGYEFLLIDKYKAVVHKNDKGLWNVTLKQNGLSIISNIKTRKEVINQSIILINEMGTDWLDNKCNEFSNSNHIPYTKVDNSTYLVSCVTE